MKRHLRLFTIIGISALLLSGCSMFAPTTSSNINYFTITWKNYDGTVLEVDSQVAEGEVPTYDGETPVKVGDAHYSFVFNGWDPEVKAATADAQYVAQFTTETNKYTITWKNYDGTVLETDKNVPYGTMPTYDGETPTRVDTRGAATYTFKDWDPVVTNVTGTQTYTATYDAVGTFVFEPVKYQMKEGYTLSDINGAPWINTNLRGEINKIEKPSLKDDFYTAVNYDLLKNNMGGGFDACDGPVNRALYAIFQNDEHTTNGDFLKAAFDKMRDGDASNISASLSNINLATYLSSKDLFATDGALCLLIPNNKGYEVKYNDGYYTGYNLHTLMFFMQHGYPDYQEPCDNIVNYLNDVLSLSLNQTTINSVYAYENTLTYRAYYDNYYNSGSDEYTVNTIPWTSLKNALLDAGLASTDKITIKKMYNNVLGQLFNNYSVNNTDIVKAALELRLAFANRFLLGTENYRALNAFIKSAKLFPYEDSLGHYDDYNLSRALTTFAYQIVIEQSYIELEGSETVKADVTALIKNILDGYKQIMQENNNWAKATKEGINKKLEKMAYASCYSDNYKTFKQIAGNNFSNLSLANLNKLYQDTIISCTVDKNIDLTGYWDYMHSYTVNAYYSPTTNSFVILNGLAKGLMGDSVEETYALLGTVIGHEITHAFDSSGSFFDEYGNYKENGIFATRDVTKFNTKVAEMSDFYNSITLFGHNSSTDENAQDKVVMADGNKINGEATADMGGVKVMLKLAEQIEDFDYKLFFESYAYLWCGRVYDLPGMYERIKDEHPLNYLRTNVTLAQFDKFIETYDIQPGDGMYIPEEERVAIWQLFLT